jgi:hypothetical protein
LRGFKDMALVRELLMSAGMNKLSAFVIATVISLFTFVAVGAASSGFSADFVRVAFAEAHHAPAPATTPRHG